VGAGDGIDSGFDESESGDVREEIVGKVRACEMEKEEEKQGSLSGKKNRNILGGGGGKEITQTIYKT